MDGRAARTQRSVRRILDAAATMFGRDGYMGASMNAVARAAGVSKGLLHYHFETKEHLLIEAQRAAFRRIHRRFDERFQAGESSRAAAMDALDAMYASLRELYAWAPFLVETLTLAHQNAEVREHLDQFYDESMSLLEDGVRRLFPSDDDTLPLPPDRLVRLVRTALHGLLVDLALAESDADLARVDQTWADLRALFADYVLADPRA